MKMKNFSMKMIVVALVLALAMVGMMGCDKGEQPGATDPPSGNLKVAMVMTSQINDGGWGESAYTGLMIAEEKFGIDTAYTELAEQADFETIIRDYAEGYDVIILVGNEFSDVSIKVAPSFPDVKFCCMNGNESLAPNLAAYRFNTPETGFVAGALAALYSETGTVGMILGATQPQFTDSLIGFQAGAKYVNPDIKILDGNTDSLQDVARGKEMGISFIEQGADILCANANTTALGVIDAAKSKGIRYIGYLKDQHKEAPETIMVSMVQSNEYLISAIVETVLDGRFVPELDLVGMADGAIYMSEFYGHDEELPEGGLDKINEIIEKIKDGSLKAEGILPKSGFEK